MAADPIARKVTQTFESDPGYLNPYTAIPQRVIDHFLVNTSSVVTLASAHSMMMSQMHAHGRTPVHFKELPEELVDELRASGYVVHEADGTIRKADCCLYRQGEAERQGWRDRRLYEQLQREDPEALLDAVDQARKETERMRGGKAFFRPAEPRDFPVGMRRPGEPDHALFDEDVADDLD